MWSKLASPKLSPEMKAKIVAAMMPGQRSDSRLGAAGEEVGPAEAVVGDGAQRAMKAALKRANLGTDQIDYVNAHGTSTMADVIELGAVKKTFGQDAYKLSMSSTKSATGHLLGAAGAIEAIYAIKSVIEQAVPPTLNLDEPDEGCDIDLVPKQAKQRKVRYALSNSFGFGGTNGTLVFKAI